MVPEIVLGSQRPRCHRGDQPGAARDSPKLSVSFTLSDGRHRCCAFRRRVRSGAPSSSADPIGILLDRAYAGIPAPARVGIFHNTIFSGSSGGGFVAIWLSSGTSAVVVKNNLVSTPTHVGPLVIQNSGSISPLIANNTAEGSGAESLKTDATFTVTPPTTPGHYKPTCSGATYPCGKGANVAVWQDYFGQAQPATRDLGGVTH